MPAAAKKPQAQEELPLSSVLSHTVFPGRTSLYVSEVARSLSMTEQQVLDLIEERRLGAVNIASGLLSADNPKGNKTSRRFWRIPVSAYDAFINTNTNKHH